jgi:hypothetical protein
MNEHYSMRTPHEKKSGSEARLLCAMLWLCLWLIVPSASQAQRLYDEARDKKAQEAAKLAEEISSNAAFLNQLKNLDTLAKRDVELHFRGVKRQMELDLNAFRTWGAISQFVEGVKTTLFQDDFISTAEANKLNDDLELECKERKTELGQAICKAEDELKKLKHAVKDSEAQGKILDEELKTRLEKIDVIESLVGKASAFLKSGSAKNETLKGFAEVFLNLSESYLNYTNKLAVIKNQPRDELKLLLQRIAVEALQLEADHWATIADIKLRRSDEQKDLQRLVKDYEFRVKQISKCVPASASFEQEKIAATFAKAQKATTLCQITNPADPSTEIPLPKEELLAYLFEALHSAAALAARGDTPQKLAQLRLAQQEHSYSIRQSAIFARGYELALNSGAKRLARYYAGGLRPEKIAQLIYTAATVAIPAVIAGK